MNKTEKIWRLVPVSLFGVLLLYTLVSNADEDFFMFDFFLWGVCILFFLTCFSVIRRDIQEYREYKSNWSFLPTAWILLFTLSFFVTNYLLKTRDKSPVVIESGFFSDFNGASFDFREDGTYKFGDLGLGANYYRGAYTIKDSIITIDNAPIADRIKSRKLLICSKSDEGNKTRLVIYPMDSTNTKIDSTWPFVVRVDNRKK